MCPREMNSASKLVARKYFTSAEGFLNATSPWGPFFGDSQLGRFVERPWVFRGQGDSTWPLLASVFRENGDLPDGRIARFHQRGGAPKYPTERRPATNSTCYSASFSGVFPLFWTPDQAANWLSCLYPSSYPRVSSTRVPNASGPDYNSCRSSRTSPFPGSRATATGGYGSALSSTSRRTIPIRHYHSRSLSVPGTALYCSPCSKRRTPRTYTGSRGQNEISHRLAASGRR